MKARVLTLHLDPDTGCFDDSSLVDLLADTDALQVTDHLFIHDGVPTLVLIVRYRASVTPARSAGTRTPRSARPDPTAALAEADLSLFDALRRWRNDRSKADGRPAYVLFTNAQLAAIASARPATLIALQDVHGVGQARARDYGADVLAIVQSVPAGAQSQEAADVDPADRPG